MKCGSLPNHMYCPGTSGSNIRPYQDTLSHTQSKLNFQIKSWNNKSVLRPLCMQLRIEQSNAVKLTTGKPLYFIDFTSEVEKARGINAVSSISPFIVAMFITQNLNILWDLLSNNMRKGSLVEILYYLSSSLLSSRKSLLKSPFEVPWPSPQMTVIDLLHFTPWGLFRAKVRKICKCVESYLFYFYFL